MVFSWILRNIFGTIFSFFRWLFQPFLVALLSFVPPVFLRFVFGSSLHGIKGIIIKIALGFGAVLAAAVLSSWCPQLGIIFIVFAIIIADFFGVIGVYILPRFPYIGPTLEPIIAPISGSLHLILMLCAALFILQLLSILRTIPILGTAISLMNIIIPLVIIYIIWGNYVPAVEGLSQCFGEGLSLPGVGRVRIGT